MQTLHKNTSQGFLFLSIMDVFYLGIKVDFREAAKIGQEVPGYCPSPISASVLRDCGTWATSKKQPRHQHLPISTRPRYPEFTKATFCPGSPPCMQPSRLLLPGAVPPPSFIFMTWTVLITPGHAFVGCFSLRLFFWYFSRDYQRLGFGVEDLRGEGSFCSHHITGYRRAA